MKYKYWKYKPGTLLYVTNIKHFCIILNYFYDEFYKVEFVKFYVNKHVVVCKCTTFYKYKIQFSILAQ